MYGLMMDQPLLISDLLRHADRHHGLDRDRVEDGGRRDPSVHLPRKRTGAHAASPMP